MVKPPKTMQPEAFDLSKAGRASGKAFKDDSFHQYMARKIDLQRQQFGVLLPPPPPPPPSPLGKDAYVNKNRNSTNSATYASSTNSPSRVRFSPCAIERKRRRSTHDKGSMATILNRLQKRHGHNLRRFERKKRRHQVCHSHGHTELDENDDTIEEGPCSHPNVGSAPFKTDHGDNEMVQAPQADSPTHSPGATTPLTSMTPSQTKKLRPDLFFLGVVVKVNGYTNPDNEALKRMLQKHGGDLETYETQRVTHIVAEHLSKAKADIYKKQKDPRPVCSPSWIVDSVREGRLLPHGRYLLEELKDRGGQVGIRSLFGRETGTRPAPVSSGEQTKKLFLKPSVCPQPMEVTRSEESEQALLLQNCSQHFEQRAGAQGKLGDSKSIAGGNGDPIDNTFTSLDKGRGCVDDNRSSAPHETQQLAAAMQPKAITGTAGGAHSHGAMTLSSEYAVDKRLGKTDDKYINGKIRTVGTDPQFLETFFSSSRLSFIGSYRQRTSTSAISSPTKKSAIYGQNTRHLNRYVFHVDMDCFFASVVLRKYPQHKDKPVAISHHGKGNPNTRDPIPTSKNSTSECATCNYKAREYGIKKGMFLGRAKQLCPDLIVLYYDFEGYEEVSEQVLEILQKLAEEHHGVVEAVSCDEAYMELFIDNEDHAKRIAETTRVEIFETTQGTASIGVAENKFLAKVGTDRAKPNGSYVVKDYKDLLKNLKLRDLHGIGYRSGPKLNAEGLISVQDVWDCGANAESLLCRILGQALGRKIFDFCQGKDERPVKSAERKTIGAECNYGVRFDGPYGIDHFMFELAKEVQKRMEGVGVFGRQVTLKLKKRKQGAKPPPKFLGHGSCHNLSKSTVVPGSIATRDATIIRDVGMTLFNELAAPLDDVRGMGIIISKLDTHSPADRNCDSGISSWLNAGGKSKSNFQDNETALLHETGATPCAKDATRPSLGRKPEHDESAPNDSRLGYFESDISNLEAFDSTMPESPSCAIAIDPNLAEETEVPSPMFVNSGLPPLSQIRMSQLDALPDDIREEIESTLKATSVSGSARRKEERYPIACLDDDITGNQAVVREESVHNVDDDASICKARFRQMDLKRLMKLAAVKSGSVNTGISLTQLDHLPLEIKLQVVNQDAQPLGVLSQRKKPPSDLRRNSEGPEENRIYPRTPRAAEVAETVIDAREFDLFDSLQSRETNTMERPSTDKDSSCVQEGVGVLEGPEDLYEADILPLKCFLDENEPTNPEAVDHLCEFLSICVREGRLHDIVVMVRSIRNRDDKWGVEGVLRTIACNLDQQHFEVAGCHLDLDWLFGGITQ